MANIVKKIIDKSTNKLNNSYMLILNNTHTDNNQNKSKFLHVHYLIIRAQNFMNDLTLLQDIFLV